MDREKRQKESLGLVYLLKAIRFAADKHRDARRKGTDASPYINHPIEVAYLVAESGESDPRVLAAAVLHDTLEDTKTTSEEIEREFGPEVRALVEELTDLPKSSDNKAERKREQLERAPRLSPAAKRIRIADKIANARDVLERPPKDWSEERKRQYVEWCRSIVAACRDEAPDLASIFDSTVRAALAKVP